MVSCVTGVPDATITDLVRDRGDSLLEMLDSDVSKFNAALKEFGYVKLGQRQRVKNALLSRSTVRTGWRYHDVPAEPDSIAVPPDGVAAALLPQSDSSSTFTPCGTLCVEVLSDGLGGAKPRSGDVVQVHYACLLASSGCCVDASRSKMFGRREPYAITLGSHQVVPGMELGIRALTLGSLARLHVPPQFGYGDREAGPIRANAHLVFEVELLAINERQAEPRRSWLLRRLLLLRSPPDLAERAPSLPGAASVAAALQAHMAAPPEALPPPVLVQHPPEVLAAAAAAAAQDERHAAASSPEVIADGPATTAASSPPPWLSRVRSALPLPTPECRSFYELARAHSARLPLPSADSHTTSHTTSSTAASTSPTPAPSTAPSTSPSPSPTAASEAFDASADLGPQLIGGATPIRHAPYGTPWDGAAPLVLTGDRGAATGWPAAQWGWEYWEREHGDQYVTCKQRAPIFDSDQTSDTLIVETTLREALQYARTAHLSGALCSSLPRPSTHLPRPSTLTFNCLPHSPPMAFHQVCAHGAPLGRRRGGRRTAPVHERLGRLRRRAFAVE